METSKANPTPAEVQARIDEIQQEAEAMRIYIQQG